MGAQVLVENNVFRNVTHPLEALYSKQPGFFVAAGNDFGGKNPPSNATVGTMSAAGLPYKYTLIPTADVEATVTKSAGATLHFSDIA